jgi:glycine cleavage system H protein
MYPDDLKYTNEHEWARPEGDRATVGITHYAQDALGDIVYVDLPPVGTAVTANQTFGEVESTKSVSDIYSPVTGTIVERNDELDKSPELINTDPYGQGWLVVIELADADELDELMDAGAYSDLVAES